MKKQRTIHLSSTSNDDDAVTAADLAKNTDWFRPAPDVEVITKTRNFDGTVDLEYEYEYEHPGEEGRVRCRSLVIVHETATKASVVYEANLTKSRAAWALKGIEFVQRDDLFNWGDASTCGLLTEEEGEISGTHFTCITGRLTFEWTVTGMYFDDAEGMANLLRPVLTRLRNYHP